MAGLYDTKERAAEIRQALEKVMWEEMPTIRDLSKKIGISHVLLAKFLKGADVSWTTLAKIDKYVRSYEAEKSSSNFKL